MTVAGAVAAAARARAPPRRPLSLSRRAAAGRPPLNRSDSEYTSTKLIIVDFSELPGKRLAPGFKFGDSNLNAGES